jgi:hypothetical protein
MRYRPLGRTGWKISEVSFGAWAIGGEWGKVSDEDAIASLSKAMWSALNNITATIVDLSMKGYLAIEQQDGSSLQALRVSRITYFICSSRRITGMTCDRTNELYSPGFLFQRIR